MRKMMAVLLVLVIAASLAACGQATKTIYVQTESVRTIGEAQILMKYEYGSDGVPVSMKTYFNDTLYQSIVYRTSGGVQYLTITDSQGNTTMQSTQQKFDDAGRLIQTSSSISGSEVSYTNYTYDDNGVLVSAVAVTAEGTVHYTYTYDEKGNLASEIQQNQDDGSYQRKEFSYGEHGYVVKESTFLAEDVLDSYMEVTYANEYTEKTLTYYTADGEPTGEVVVATYDEHGNIVKELRSYDGEVAMTTVNTYVAMEVPVEK